MTARTSETANAAITPSSAPAATTSASAESNADSDTRGAGIDEELLEEQVEFERQPFDADHVPLMGMSPEDFGPGGWQVENHVILDWDGDGSFDVVVQFVEIPYDGRPDDPGDRSRGLVFATGDGDGLRRVGLGSFLPSTNSGGAMWGSSPLQIELATSGDGREVAMSWVMGARDRSSFEMVFAWDTKVNRLRLIRRTNSWSDALEGGYGSREEDFVAGKLTTTENPADGAPVVKKSRFSPKWIAIEDARPED